VGEVKYTGVLMPAFLQRYSLIIYLLIFFLIFPPQVWAASSGPDADPPITLKKIAVIEVHDGTLKPQWVEKVADTLRDELSHQGGFQVVSKKATQSFFKNNRGLLNNNEGIHSLNRYLDQAKEFYKNFNFKEAIRVLENTIETYRHSITAQLENFLLAEAYIMLGNIYLGARQKRKARDSFQKAVRLDPERVITDQKYPPKTVRFYQKVREDFLSDAKLASLEVGTSPSESEIYLNGAYKGITPLVIPRFTPGEHFIYVKKTGYQSLGKKIDVASSGTQEKLILKKKSKAPFYSQGMRVHDLKNTSGLVPASTQIGKAMGLDKLILVSVEEVGWNYKITARMIDLRYRAFHKHKSVEILDFHSDTRPAAAVIAKDLKEKAPLDLAQNPKKYAESEVVVIGKKKKKPFYKSPILWSIVGVLVAGGAATGIILGRRGGGGGGNDSTVSVSGATSAAP